MGPDAQPRRGRPLPRTLDVYRAGELAGRLDRRSGGRMRFTYAAPDAPRVSVSMPVQTDPCPPDIALPFFAGLLPDESLWSTIGLRLGRGGAGPYDLLALLGRDTAGALQLLPQGAAPDPTTWAPPERDDPTVEWLDEPALAGEVASLARAPLGINEARRFSLAGAQEKLLVVRDADGVPGIPLQGRPSTHILKPDPARFPGAARSELLCMRLARVCGLDVASVQEHVVAGEPALLVERFDRRTRRGAVERVHQEDACQALSIMPQDRYEDQGGPAFVDVLDLLGRVSARAAADRLELLRRAVFSWLVGNADAHGKNHALLHTSSGVVLAPAYDVLCTEAFVDGQAMAMAIGGEWEPGSVRREHWSRLVADAGMGPRTVDLLASFARTVEARVQRVAEEPAWAGLPEIVRPVVERAAARARWLQPA